MNTFADINAFKVSVLFLFFYRTIIGGITNPNKLKLQ